LHAGQFFEALPGLRQHHPCLFEPREPVLQALEVRFALQVMQRVVGLLPGLQITHTEEATDHSAWQLTLGQTGSAICRIHFLDQSLSEFQGRSLGRLPAHFCAGGSIFGGFGAAFVGRRLPRVVVCWFVIAVGLGFSRHVHYVW
jgi:hypothetical protein